MTDQADSQSVEDRMMAFLDAPEEGEEEVIEEATEEAQEEDSQEEPQPVRKLKLTHNGEEIEKDEAEVIALAQQGFDYTQKTQKVADERKALEMQAQAIKAQEQNLQEQAKLQQAFIKDIGKAEALADQIAQYEAVDWSSLSDQDPVQAQKLWIQYQQLQNNRTKVIGEIQQKQQALTQQRELQNQARLEEAKAELLRAFPNWNADLAKEIRESGKAYGFTETELSNVTDPRTVKLLHDAAKYRALQANKSATTQKVQGKPAVVKPGTKDASATARTQDTKAREALRKTGRPEYAAQLIERLL